MDCARNIITANFSGGGTSATTAPLWQWDYGQVLCITGIEDLPAAFEVHFSTNRTGGVSTVAVGADGQVTIPNVLLTIGKNLNAWIYLSDSEGDGETEYAITIPVKARPMPETYDAEATGVFDDVVRQVSEYAQTAQTAADNAGASATAAAASADNAAASASAAETAKTAAETAQGKAEDAQAAAETAAQTATQKAQQSAQSAEQAASDAGRAESAAQRAETAQTGAEAAKTAAETAAQNAAASASAASASSTSAGQAASAAAQSASAAAQSAASIEGDVQTATQKASEATTAAGQAVTAKDAAVTAQTAAETAATNAGQSASTATTKAAEAAQSASGAAQSKTDAEAAATRAEQAAASLTVDDALSDTSENPVQNKVITGEVAQLKNALQHVNPQHVSGAVVGRNLFNKYNVKTGFYVDGSDGILKSNPNYCASDYIPIEPSTHYEGNATAHFAWYDTNKTYISGKYNVRLNETSPSNAAFLVHDCLISAIDLIIICRDLHGSGRDYSPFTVQYPWHIPELNLNAFDFYKWGAYFVNMFNADEAIDGQYVESTNGDFSNNASYFRSDYIPIEPDTTYKVSHPNRYAVYDSEYVYLEGANLSGTSGEFTTPSDAKYVVVCYNSLTAKSSYVLAKLSEYPSGYESYGIVVPWLKQETGEINVPKSKYDGKKLVCFGDSITNMGYIDAINSDTGIEAINVGLSSGRYAYSDDSNQYVNAFAFHNICDSISTNNWTIPDSINGVSGYETQYAHIQAIKAIDFSTVDFVSIAYGTNDFSSATALDNESNPLDTNTFKGAIRYCLKTLTEKYPHLKIIGVTPCYRFWSESGSVLYDSDDHSVGGFYLRQYVEAIEEVYAEYHLPVVNNYTNAGINKYNRLQYFSISDGLHPNANGRALIGHRIGNGILANY